MKQFIFQNLNADSAPGSGCVVPSPRLKTRGWILGLLALALASSAFAIDDYRSTIHRAQDRLARLESKLYGIPPTQLSADEQTEHFRLVGQLNVEDPLWVLMNQLVADIDVLARSAHPSKAELLATLKEFLVLLAADQEVAKNQKEAEAMATTWRKLIITRDVTAARQWVKTRP